MGNQKTMSSSSLLLVGLASVVLIASGEDLSCLSKAAGTPCCCCHCAGGSKCAGKICCYPDQDGCTTRDGKVWKPHAADVTTEAEAHARRSAIESKTTTTKKDGDL